MNVSQIYDGDDESVEMKIDLQRVPTGVNRDSQGAPAERV